MQARGRGLARGSGLARGRIWELAALLAVLGAWEAGACEEIRFAPGTSSAEIRGLAPADEVICYQMRTGAGQRAFLEVREGRNTVFSVEGLADAQDRYRFTTRGGVQRIFVSQLFRAVAAEPFRLFVQVEAAAARQAEGGDWKVTSGNGRVRAIAGNARRGSAQLTVSCSRARGLQVFFEAPEQAGLPRGNGAVGQARLVISGKRGERHFPVELRRIDGSDQYWEVLTRLDRGFLDDFAAGARIRLIGPAGAEAAGFGLRGSARARAAMEMQCGL